MGKKLDIKPRNMERLYEEVVNNQRSIADYMKRRVSLFEEKKTIMNFAESNCEIEEDKADREENFRLMRNEFLKIAHEGIELDYDCSKKRLRAVPNKSD